MVFQDFRYISPTFDGILKHLRQMQMRCIELMLQVAGFGYWIGAFEINVKHRISLGF